MLTSAGAGQDPIDGRSPGGEAGTHETGTHETGTHDTGSHDTGIHDTGSHDTGTHDTGTHDTDSLPRVPPSVAPVRFGRNGRRLIILGSVLVAAIFGMAGLLIVIQRANILAETQRNSDNLALLLAEQTSRTLQSVDLTLRELQDQLSNVAVEATGRALDLSSKPVFDLLTDRLKGLPQVNALMVLGANGKLLNYSRGFPVPPLDVTDRDYFRYFSTHDDHSLFVSTPVKGYLQGNWTVFLSRRINNAQGAFAGISSAAVTLSFLEDFYKAVTPENGSVLILRRDGTILFRKPLVEAMIGKKMPPESPWYGMAEMGGGSYRTPGYLDSVARRVSVRPLLDFPVVVDVTTDEAVSLIVWRTQVMWILAGATISAAGVIFLLWLFGSQYSRLANQNALLETGRQHFNAVLDNMSQGLTFFDAQQKLIVCNRRYGEIYRLAPDQIRPGTSLAEIVDVRVANGSFPNMSATEYLTRRRASVAPEASFDVTDEFVDGRTVSMHYQPLPTGGWVVTHEEITERRRTETALAFMARHDALTGLPNRILFQERLAEAVGATRRGGHCALLCLDLDRFKVINDTLGHPAGDGLLRAVAARLLCHVREGDTVARLGGDEFAIILAGLRSPEDAAPLAERIIEAAAEPYDIDGHRIVGGTSVGVSIAPKDGILSDELLRCADIALYMAKAEGRGTYRFFEPEIDALVHRRRAVELDLRNALPEEDFLVHYQPILDLGTGRVTGFEALVRWQHKLRGMVSPVDFIPIAEETGLIVQIGAWVLRKACQEAAGWPADIEIAVNLSPVQFRRGRLLEAVQEALAVSGLAPERLELEITESTLLTNSGDTVALLHQLRALGIRIALDDFGTGYSSLSYLRSFPFNKIKIDQSFIRDLDTNRESAAIVGAIVGLARSLGMTTVAEGLETPQQLTMVRDQGCAKVQGYLFSRPCPAAEVPAMIRGLRVPGTDADTPSADPDQAPRPGAVASEGSVRRVLLKALLTA